MPARVMLTIVRTLPDDRAVLEMENMRSILERSGWFIAAEACDPLEEPVAAPPTAAVVVPTFVSREPEPVPCPHCHGVGRAAGIDCGVCKCKGKIPA